MSVLCSVPVQPLFSTFKCKNQSIFLKMFSVSLLDPENGCTFVILEMWHRDLLICPENLYSGSTVFLLNPHYMVRSSSQGPVMLHGNDYQVVRPLQSAERKQECFLGWFVHFKKSTEDSLTKRSYHLVQTCFNQLLFFMIQLPSLFYDHDQATKKPAHHRHFVQCQIVPKSNYPSCLLPGYSVIQDLYFSTVELFL